MTPECFKELKSFVLQPDYILSDAAKTIICNLPQCECGVFYYDNESIEKCRQNNHKVFFPEDGYSFNGINCYGENIGKSVFRCRDTVIGKLWFWEHSENKPANIVQIPEDFPLKVEVKEKLALITELAYSSDNPDFLRWLRNRLGEPYKVIQKRLNDADENIRSPIAKRG